MKKRTLQFTGIALAALSIFSMTACGSGNNQQQKLKLLYYDTYAYFNMAQSRWAFENNNAEADYQEVWEDVRDVFSRVDQSVSLEANTSVSKFNAAQAGERVEIDQTAYELFETALEIYEKTEGAYNPALGWLIDLWGFSPRFNELDYEPSYPFDREKPGEQLPDQKYVDAFLTITDFSQVELFSENGRFYAVKPDVSVTMDEIEYTMQLNLGGIGKGYAVDEAEKVIREAKYRYGYLSLGGSSMSLFQHPLAEEEDGVQYWQIGVSNPRGSGSFVSVRAADISLSSSGDYEQKYVIDGRRYSHIINPQTGYPVNAEPENPDGSGIICASVFGVSAAEGDATTTALMVMGKEKACAYIKNELSGAKALFLYWDAVQKKYTMYTNMKTTDYVGLLEAIDTVEL